MLFLDETLPNIKRAQAEHVRYVTCRINKKLFGTNCAYPNCPVCLHTQLIRTPSLTLKKLRALLQYETFLEAILTSKPNDLIQLSNFLWSALVPNFSWAGFDEFIKIRNMKVGLRSGVQQAIFDNYNDAIKAFTSVFEYYGWFGGDDNIRYDAYQLALNLNRNTCTYCNRIYTHTIKGKNNSKIMRPQFDHWFSRSKHPGLGLSFYNLIPSCSVCNSSVKGALDFDLTTHLHPYVDVGCQEKFKYDYEYRRSTRRYHVSIESLDPSDVRIEKTFEDLKLMEVYDTHHAELAELIKIKNSYSTKYINKLIKAFPKAHLSEKEVYRLAFSAEFEESEFYKRPLSKFKKDILRKLKLIK